MPVFEYIAKLPSGRRESGREEAATSATLASTLKSRGWLVLSIRIGTDVADSRRLSLWNPLHWLPARSVDVEIGFQQIAVMLRSGLTLLAALRTTAEQAQRARMAIIWHAIADRIQQGGTFADSLAEFPRFSYLAIQMIRVGEQTGNLDSILTRVAESQERRRMLKTQLFTALFYPTLVLIAAVAVSAVIVFYLIPKLRVFLSALGKKLPPMTQALVDIAEFFQIYGIEVLLGLIGLTAGFVLLYLWQPARLFLDRMSLRLPILGHLFRLAATAQFAHALGVLLSSGITLVEALRTVERLFRNRFLTGIVGRAREAVLAGGQLSEPLAVQGGFLPMLPKMATVGETAGSLDDMMAEVARFHEAQLQSTIRRFSVIIEPVIIVVVGGIVGFVYIAFFMALFSVAGGGGR